MKLKRNLANRMFRTLGTMALGHLDTATLDAVMNNINALRKVAEDYENIRQELTKRLYADVEETRRKKFFDLVTKMEVEKDMNKRAEYISTAEASYPDIWTIYLKHIEVINSLLDKEVEVELTEVNLDLFVKGIVKGKKDAPVLEIMSVFAPMLKKEDKADTDFSELEELLKN